MGPQWRREEKKCQTKAGMPILLASFHGLNECWYGTDFSVQSRFQYWSLGSCGSTVSVLVPRFLFLLHHTGFRYKVFRGLFAFLLFRNWFGSISVPFRLYITHLSCLLVLSVAKKWIAQPFPTHTRQFIWLGNRETSLISLSEPICILMVLLRSKNALCAEVKAIGWPNWFFIELPSVQNV